MNFSIMSLEDYRLAVDDFLEARGARTSVSAGIQL